MPDADVEPSWVQKRLMGMGPSPWGRVGRVNFLASLLLGIWLSHLRFVLARSHMEVRLILCVCCDYTVLKLQKDGRTCFKAVHSFSDAVNFSGVPYVWIFIKMIRIDARQFLSITQHECSTRGTLSGLNSSKLCFEFFFAVFWHLLHFFPFVTPFILIHK